MFCLKSSLAQGGAPRRADTATTVLDTPSPRMSLHEDEDDAESFPPSQELRAGLEGALLQDDVNGDGVVSHDAYDLVDLSASQESFEDGPSQEFRDKLQFSLGDSAHDDVDDPNAGQIAVHEVLIIKH